MSEVLPLLSCLAKKSQNPSVKSDCSGIKVGNSYCVEVTRKAKSSSAAPTPTVPSASATPIQSAKPSPTQDGLIESCTNFYFAVANDNCAKIAKKYGTFTEAEFIAWNPAVGSDCSGIWAKTWYCVGIPGTPTAPVSTTLQPSATSSSTPKPSPTQDGLIESCTNFYFAVANDNCAGIAKKYGTFTEAQFIAWNPAVGSDCSGIWAKTWYCVGIPGTPTKAPVTSTAAPTSTKPTSTGNGIATPLPTQPGMVSNCDDFYFVSENENCQTIVDKKGITMAQFLTWNPDVGGTGCPGMWAKAYVCVSIIGHTPGAPKPSSTVKTSATPTPTGCTVSHPEPTQPGALCNCKQWYKTIANEYCADIAKKFGISEAQFLNWNNSVGSSCGGLWKDTYVCVKA